MPGFGQDFTIKGFLDSRKISSPELPILGNPLDYEPGGNDEFVIALSDPASKKDMAEHLRIKGARFFNVIHPENSVSSSFISGEGLIIAPYNSISNRVTFGDFVSIYGFCKIGHDLQIGNFCHIASHCSIDGFSRLSDDWDIPSFTKILKNTRL
jgi:UDP-3-O-[3-hydroxymyristoyl] glucosamine N-acyltransferase